MPDQAQPPNAPKVRDPNFKRVEEACARLREHFDHVQIFAGTHDAEHGKFSEVDAGTGSWLARYGHVRTWLVVQDEITRRRVE